MGKLIPATNGNNEWCSLDKRVPSWAQGSKNLRGWIPWDSEMYVGLVKINNCLVEAIIDTGGSKSMIDEGTAHKCGLWWKAADRGELGKFVTPGGQPQDYSGVI